MILTENKTVLTFGKGDNGRLGDGTTISKSSPVSISGNIQNVTKISAGGEHSILVDGNGDVYTFGSNFVSQTHF